REAARRAAPGRRGDIAGADGRGGGGDGAGRGSALGEAPAGWGGGGAGGRVSVGVPRACQCVVGERRVSVGVPRACARGWSGQSVSSGQVLHGSSPNVRISHSHRRVSPEVFQPSTSSPQAWPVRWIFQGGFMPRL